MCAHATYLIAYMKTDLFDIKDKIIVITGGYGVLGTCISKYLAQQGSTVIVLGRNKEKGSTLIDEITRSGGKADFIISDVTDKTILTQNREEILHKYGRIDILINAAGGNMPGATIGENNNIFDLDTDAFQDVVNLNLMGTLLPTTIFMEAMVKSGAGNIINFSSMSALRPLTRVAGYGSAKAAVTNFTQYMAGELATKFGEKFRVNAIAPGFFLTEQNRTLLTNPDNTLTARGKTIVAHTPFRRFGNPDELLGSVHYLISDASQFVTGSVLVVDGGFNAFSI